jgi:vacuolar-type H+-ATPase subunit B/Vma2
MTNSLLKIRFHNGLLHTQYKIENVPIETALHIGWFAYERLAKDSEYRLKYTFSKKMRQAINTGS